MRRRTEDGQESERERGPSSGQKRPKEATRWEKETEGGSRCDVGGERGEECKARERNGTEQGCSSVQRAGIAAGAPFCCSCISIRGYMHHPPHPSDHDGDDDDGDGDSDDDDDDNDHHDDDGNHHHRHHHDKDENHDDHDDDDDDAAGKQEDIGRVGYPSLFVVAATSALVVVVVVTVIRAAD